MTRFRTPGEASAPPTEECSPWICFHVRPSSRVTYRSTPPTPEGPTLPTSYSMLTRRLLMTAISPRPLVVAGSDAGGRALGEGTGPDGRGAADGDGRVGLGVGTGVVSLLGGSAEGDEEATTF